MKINLSTIYSEAYTQGYQARGEMIFVNPYLLDLDEKEKYTGWQDGWQDADLDIELGVH